MGRRSLDLNLEERRKIAQWLEARMPVPEIADRLSRAPSSICREIKRNFCDDKEMSNGSATAPSFCAMRIVSPGRSWKCSSTGWLPCPRRPASSSSSASVWTAGSVLLRRRGRRAPWRTRTTGCESTCLDQPSLNGTPRKCLGDRTPAEVFESSLVAIRNRLE